MNYYVTDALICLKDDLGLEYVVSQIEYKIWKNEEYEYRFRPNYSVIELLSSDIFQGIPGIDLGLRKEEYIRRNQVPTFISERAPSANREELWKLLEDCNMKYLNQLEWLIKTDTKYIGDRLYVRKAEKTDTAGVVNIDGLMSSLKRSYDIQRKILENICLGLTVKLDGLTIDDSNRKICYDLLYYLFKHERKRLRKLQSDGINKAKSSGKYRGRQPLNVDDTKFYEVFQKYESRRITAERAAELLNMSKSTFYRRVKKFENTDSKNRI